MVKGEALLFLAGHFFSKTIFSNKLASDAITE
jgi:hypothetical protein